MRFFLLSMSITLHGMLYGGIVGPCSQTWASLCDVGTYRIDEEQGSGESTQMRGLTRALHSVYVDKDSDQYLDS